MVKNNFVVVMFWVSLGLLVGIGALSDAQAESVIGDHSANGVSLTSTDTNRFDGPGSVPALDSNHNTAGATLIPAVGVTATAAAGTTLLPVFGDPKDKASGAVSATYTLGSPYTALSHDQLQFLLSGTVSAVAAKNSAGNPATAVVQGSALAHFYVDTPPVATVIGYLNLPALRNLDPAAGETLLNLKVLKDAFPILNMAAGDGAQVVDLIAGHAYDVQLDYVAQAPFGTDPPFAFQYVADVTSSPVPEPGTLALLAIATATVGLAAWRRREAVRQGA